jgi:hypothetical protein
VTTIDEYRQATGSDPWDEGGEVVKRRITDDYVTPGEEPEKPKPQAVPPQFAQPPAPDEQEGAEDDEEPADEEQRSARPAVRKMVAMSAEHRKAYDAWERRLRPYEAKMLERVEAWAGSLSDEVMARFEGSKALKFTMPDTDFLFDVDEAGTALWREVRGVALEALEAEGIRVLETVAVDGMTFDPEAPRVLNYLKQKELLVKTVAEEFHEDLRQTIIAQVRQGKPILDIADVVERKFDGLKDWQAKRIAQTETVGAMNTGAMSAIEQTGLRKEWIATLDDRVRDSHVMAMEDGAIGVDETFSNGLLHPGDPGAPAGEVVNCRCALAPVALEDE